MRNKTISSLLRLPVAYALLHPFQSKLYFITPEVTNTIPYPKHMITGITLNTTPYPKYDSITPPVTKLTQVNVQTNYYSKIALRHL